MPKPIPLSHPIILFDGTCALCSRCLQLVTARDNNHFRFTPLTSPLGQKLAHQHGINPQNPNSVALIIGATAHTQATAIGHILLKLNKLSWLGHLWLALPNPLTNRLYLFIARRRYKIFGRTTQCHPALRTRLLEK